MQDLSVISDISHQLTTDENIEKVASKMLEMDQADCPVSHHFGAGVYIREVRIPAGTFSIGHHQNKEHLNVMVQGKVAMLCEDGHVRIITAPYVYVAKPGRKIGLIMEDMIWHNIYPTDETDIDTLEETYLTKSENWENTDEGKKQIAAFHSQVDRDDYEILLDEIGLTDKQIREETENEENLMPFPGTTVRVKVSDSAIEGKGLFSLFPIKQGEIIVPARIGDKRTPAGRYTNHSARPNATVIQDGDILFLVAIRDIDGCKGGGQGEEITIDYREALKAARALQCQE